MSVGVINCCGQEKDDAVRKYQRCSGCYRTSCILIINGAGTKSEEDSNNDAEWMCSACKKESQNSRINNMSIDHKLDMLTKLMAKMDTKIDSQSANSDDKAKLAMAKMDDHQAKQTMEKMDDLSIEIDKRHADNEAKFSDIEKRMDEMMTICKNYRTELETKIATGLVKIKKDVLKTTTTLIQMTTDGIHESLGTKINEKVKPLADKLDNIERRAEQSLNSTNTLENIESGNRVGSFKERK